MRKLAFVAALLGLALAGAAHAEDKKEDKVDCKDTDLGFTDSSFDVKCADISDSSVNVDEGLAGVKAKKLFAIRQDDGVTFLLTIDLSVLGSRVYFRRESLEEDVTHNFTQAKVTDWESANNTAGFDMATFTGSFDSGVRLHCIGFRREMNRRYEGVGRKVVGISCADQDSDHAIAALRKLTAPGG